MRISTDLRPAYFSRTSWYATLDGQAAATWAAWRVLKSDEPAWWLPLLNAAFCFSEHHGLRDHFRARLGGIHLPRLSSSAADRENRAVLFPVWEIVNELIVAQYLERVLSWTFVHHEPRGNKTRRGDWEFASTSGTRVFVEVKSLAEPDPRATGVYSRSSKSPRIRTVLKEAYAQLPDDGRSTLVVLVGDEALKIPFGVIHGDLFQALFGQLQVTFPIDNLDDSKVRMGPSLRDMFVHGTKHRRLGFAGGMVYGGDELPGVRLYGVHNPFAVDAVRVPAADLTPLDQVVFDSGGHGELRPGVDPREAWSRMQWPETTN